MDSDQMDKLINSKDQHSIERFATTKATSKIRSNSLDRIQAKELRNTANFGETNERFISYQEVPKN